MGITEQLESELLRCFFKNLCVCSEGILYDDESTKHVKIDETFSAIPFIRSRLRSPLLEYPSDGQLQEAVMVQEIRAQ